MAKISLLKGRLESGVMSEKSGVVLKLKTRKSAGAIDPAEVARAADVLQQAYGDDAVGRARKIEAETISADFAAAVTAELERRLRTS